MTTRRIFLDASILIRAVLGNKVLKLITAYADEVDFGAPEVAFREPPSTFPTSPPTGTSIRAHGWSP